MNGRKVTKETEWEEKSMTEERECCKYKHREPVEQKDLLTRLNRIEGQVRGIKNMVEQERYCIDILTQVSAAQAALSSFSKVLLANHIKTCVVNDIEKGELDVVDELCTAIQKMMK